MRRLSILAALVGVAAAICVMAVGTAVAQDPTGPPVFSGLFGSRDLAVETPNNPGNDYTMILHANDSPLDYDDIEYDAGRGYGFVAYDTGNPDRNSAARFGPFDDSPNNRGNFEPEDQLYDSFIGFKNHPEACDETVVGDLDSPCSTVIDPSGGIFRVDVPNGNYRFVGVFGDSDNTHAHRVLVEDGGSGGPVDIGDNSVVLVSNHDQAQFDIGMTTSDLGDGVFARVGFGDMMPPEAQGVLDYPVFVDMDANGLPLVDADNVPTGAPPSSPTLSVTQGYLRLHLLQGNSNPGIGSDGDVNGADIVLFEVVPVAGGAVAPVLQAGDADMNLEFNQLDLVQVQIAAKYLTGAVATWGEGDWDGAPGGSAGSPPAGNGFFDQLDIISALTAGKYLQGPYAALGGVGASGDEQTSLVYNAGTGELSVDAPASKNLTSVNIDSAGSLFNVDNVNQDSFGGSFDNASANNLFKATFGSEFGDLSLGVGVMPAGMSAADVTADLTAVGSQAGGGDLGAVDLVYVPEPTSIVLLAVALLGLLPIRPGRRR